MNPTPSGASNSTPSGASDPSATTRQLSQSDEMTRPWIEPPTFESEMPTQPTQSARSPQLVITQGPGAGYRFPLATPCTIGRGRDCDIVLDDTSVSRLHAEIQLERDRYTITDADSLNSTYLNRQPVAHAKLTDGDELWIGKFHLRFQTP